MFQKFSLEELKLFSSVTFFVTVLQFNNKNKKKCSFIIIIKDREINLR